MPRRTAVTVMRGLFESAGLDDPSLDARLLAAHALSLDVLDFALAPDLPVGDGAMNLALVAHRRLSREPVARILGRWEFYGLPFDLTAGTLVPRPDTETVVDAALAGIDRTAPLRILDLGTGSGVILVALLRALPRAIGIGVDLSSGAVATATRNAVENGVGDRAAFLVGNWANALVASFDLVVSNPPYIATAIISRLGEEVRCHDPLLALDGGEDGLDAYRVIGVDLPRLMATNGRAVLEIGYDQADAVAALLSAQGLGPAKIVHDLGGRPRAVVVCRR